MTVNVMRGRRPATGSAGAATPGWAPLAVMLTGTFMIVLDFFIVNVAIPSMQRHLHASAAGVEWVVTAYGLTYGVGLITGGRLGDRYGRRRMFMLGLAVFTLASLACGLATNIEMLNVSRAIQGLGAAVAGPQTLAMIGLTYAGRQRVTAVTAYGVSLGLAAVLGQLFGGVLIQANLLGLDWRSCFLVNLPVGVIALAAARRVLTESRAPAGDSIDLVGTVLVTAGLVAVILPLVDGRQAHWPVWAWALLAAAGPILAGFAGHQTWRRRHGKTPLVDLSVLADRTVGAGLVATGVFYAAMASFFVVLALYLQEGRGLSALGSGAVFTVVGAGYLAASMVPQSVMGRLGRQWPALGGVVMAAGYVALALTSARPAAHQADTGGSAPERAAAAAPAAGHRDRHGHADRAADRDRAGPGGTGTSRHGLRPAGHHRAARQLDRGGGDRGGVLQRAARRLRPRLPGQPDPAGRAAAGRDRRDPVRPPDPPGRTRPRPANRSRPAKPSQGVSTALMIPSARRSKAS